MSLRDQLLKAGIASKKDAARVERQKNHERRKRKSVSEREREASETAAREAAVESKRVARKQREVEREALEAGLRVRNLIAGNTVRGRGKQPFWVKRPSGRVCRMSVSPGIAFKLRCGELGIAAQPDSDEPVVIAAKAVDRLLDLAPETVWFYAADTSGLSAPEDAFMDADWDISLVPHRKTPV
jgi:uncharacterized protein YaiL (DUF2058 family)